MKNEIGNVIGKWQKDNRVRNLSPDTIESYGASARDFQAFFAQRKIHKMKQITDDVIRDYTLCQIDRGCAPRTINSRLKALRRLLNFYKTEIRPSYTVPNIRLQREECTSRSAYRRSGLHAGTQFLAAGCGLCTGGVHPGYRHPVQVGQVYQGRRSRF